MGGETSAQSHRCVAGGEGTPNPHQSEVFTIASRAVFENALWGEDHLERAVLACDNAAYAGCSGLLYGISQSEGAKY